MFEYKISLRIIKKKYNGGLRKDNEKERLTDRVGVSLCASMILIKPKREISPCGEKATRSKYSTSLRFLVNFESFEKSNSF